MSVASDFPKFDVHCHTTNRPLSHTASPDATLDSIVSIARGYNIQKTLLLATYFPKKGTGVSNFRMRYWMDLVHQDRRLNNPFIMFGSLDFEHYFKQGFNELEELAERKLIKGVKIYAGYQNLDLLKLETLILPLCVQHDFPIMFHTGDCTGMNGVYADVEEFDPLVEKFPNVPFLYSHLCNPNLQKVTDRVTRYKNVYTDMSGLIHSVHDRHELPLAIENVRRFYDTCGIDRLMFGTDFPVQTHADSIQIAEKALHDTASKEELQKFYWSNANEIFGGKF